MPTDKIGVALFGVGRAGLYHLPNLASHSSVRVTWLVDVSSVRDKANQLCLQYGLADAQFVDTEHCQKVFDDPQTHAVVIAVPTFFHESIIKGAVAARKHVFCEKPISFTADVVKSCYEEAQKYDCVLFCGLNRRFDRHHEELRDKLQSGSLGSPRVIHYNARDAKTSTRYVKTYIKTSGGIFCDSAIHQLDYVLWLVGETPRSVLAVGGRNSEEAANFQAYEDWDDTHITLHFQSGVVAHIEVLREARENFSYFRMEVVGTKASYFAHKATDNTLATLDMDGSGGEKRCSMDFSDSHKREMDCFIRVVQGEEPCPVLAEEVILASKLADLCQVSLTEERMVRL